MLRQFFGSYKYLIVGALGLICVLFVFQNGTCARVDSNKTVTTSGAFTSSGALTLGPPSALINPNGTVRFSAYGGTAPYQFSVQFGGGTISQNGIYTAPAAITTAGVAVTDARGFQSFANVNVVAQSLPPQLILTSSANSVAALGTIQFLPGGGTPPYQFSILSGGGSINQTGLYTAPANAATVEVRLTDLLSQSVVRTITVTAAVASPTPTASPTPAPTPTPTTSGTPASKGYFTFNPVGPIEVQCHGTYTMPVTNFSALPMVIDINSLAFIGYVTHRNYMTEIQIITNTCTGSIAPNATCIIKIKNNIYLPNRMASVAPTMNARYGSDPTWKLINEVYYDGMFATGYISFMGCN